MFVRRLTSLALVTLAAVSAQNVSQSELSSGIATVLEEMRGTRIIPNLIDESKIQLKGLLQEAFGSEKIQPGQEVSVSSVASLPTWTVEYSNDTAQQFTNQYYTVMTLDPGAASDKPRNIVRHFLANNMTIQSTGELRNLSQPVAGWFSPAPPKGTGVHRYTTLVFQQKNTEIPDSVSHRNDSIDTNFDLASYIEQVDLGPVVAATFFLCQDDDKSAKTTEQGVVSTSSVNSASISAAASSVSVSTTDN